MKVILCAMALLWGAAVWAKTNVSSEIYFQSVDISKFNGVIQQHHYKSDVVDILFVVDNSGSMSSHQNNLSKSIDAFISALPEKSDINFGVISTDMDKKAGQLLGSPKIVNGNTPDFADQLRKNVVLGTWGSANEQPLSAIVKALSPELLAAENKGFLRPGSFLMIIVISDAGESGKTTGLQAYNHLKNLMGSKDSFVVHGITATSQVTPCQRDPDGSGKEVSALIELTGGQETSLCSQNMAKDLQDSVLTTSFFSRFVPLLMMPVVSTLKVFVNGQEIPSKSFDAGWSYDIENVAVRLGAAVDLSSVNESNPLIIQYVPIEAKGEVLQ